MESSPLKVRGWVSSLNFVVAGLLALIGLSGLISGITAIAGARTVTSSSISNLIVGLGLPLGIYLFRKTAIRVRADILAEGQTPPQD